MIDMSENANGSMQISGLIAEIARTLLEKMGFTPHIQVTHEKAELYICRIQVSEDQNFLIGKLGINLAAIQHIVRILVRRKIDEKLNIIVDVNDYFAGKKEGLEKEAAIACHSALDTNAVITLRPMQAYERKVIHSYLAENEAVVTESVGQGEERRITIRPKQAP